MVGPTILGRHGIWKAMEQGHHGGNVLARMGEAREGFIVDDDPLVHVMGHGAGAPTVSVALDLLIELHTFLLELESCFLDLLVPGPQLLYPQARWGPCIPSTSLSRSSIGVALPRGCVRCIPWGYLP